MYPLIAFTLATIQEDEKLKKEKKSKKLDESVQQEDIWTFTKIGRFTFGLISQVLVFTTITSL